VNTPTIVVKDVGKVYESVAAVDGLLFSAQRWRRGLPLEFEPLQP